jgi:hypothetical protein
MFLEHGRSLIEQPILVFYRVYAAEVQEELATTDLGKGRPSRSPVVVLVNGERDAMRLNEDAFAGKALTQESSFLIVTGNDGVGVPEQPARLKKEPKDFAPFPTPAEGRIELLFNGIGQVKHPAMDGDNAGDAALFGDSTSDSADTSEGVGVNQGQILFPPQGGNQIKRHEVAPH